MFCIRKICAILTLYLSFQPNIETVVFKKRKKKKEICQHNSLGLNVDCNIIIKHEGFVNSQKIGFLKSFDPL